MSKTVKKGGDYGKADLETFLARVEDGRTFSDVSCDPDMPHVQTARRLLERFPECREKWEKLVEKAKASHFKGFNLFRPKKVKLTYSEEVIIEFINRMASGRTPYKVERDKGMPTANNVINRCKQSEKLKGMYDAAMLICYPERAKPKVKGPSRKRSPNGRQPGEPKPHHDKAPERKVMTIDEELRLDREQEKLNKAIDRRSRTIPAHINKEMLAARVMRGAII